MNVRDKEMAATFSGHICVWRDKLGKHKAIILSSWKGTIMSDYLAMLLAVLVYGSLFYFVWTMQ